MPACQNEERCDGSSGDRDASEPARKRERGGRTARREQRSHGTEGLGRPYILRNIPTYDILSEENLVRIEQTADRILAEIGIEFRDDRQRSRTGSGPAPRSTARW